MIKSWNILTLVTLLFTSIQAFSQGETTNWYFGNKAGLSFDLGVLNVLSDGDMVAPAGCATISDEEGNLLFYTNSQTIWNKNHEVMDNGDGLHGDPFHLQSSIIIPKPNSNDTYYIFTTRSEGVSTPYTPEGIFFHTVTFSAADPLGKVTSKNSPLLTYAAAEKLTAVHHADGKSIWLIAMTGLSEAQIDPKDTFQVFKIGPGGIESRTRYTTEYAITTLGAMKLSPNGKKLAVAAQTTEVPGRLIYIYDFDNTTGELEFERTIIPEPLPANFPPIDVQFSANARFLYFTTTTPGNTLASVAQYDFEPPLLEDHKFYLHFEQDLRAGSIQMGNDGKIYVSLSYGDPVSGSVGDYLGVIENPNERGFDSNYRHNAIAISPGLTRRGLPNFIQSYFASKINTENRCVSDLFNFSAESYAPIDSIEWDFGDGTTSLLMSPDHLFTSPGSYSVKATMVVGGANVTVYKRVKVFALPNLTAGQELVQCDDDTDGISLYNLYNIKEKITNINLEEELFFYTTNADAIADSNRIGDPENYVNTVPDEEVFVRVVNDNGCHQITSFFLRTSFVQLGPISDMYTCELVNSTAVPPIGNFDLRVKRNLIRAELAIPITTTIKFFPTKLDAQRETNQLNDDYDGPSGVLWMRAVQADLSCSGIQSFNVFVNPKPIIDLQDSYLICNDPNVNLIVLQADASAHRVEWLNSNNQVISTSTSFPLQVPGAYTLRAYKTENGLECLNIKTFQVATYNPPAIISAEVIENQGAFSVDIVVQGTSTYQFSINGTDYFGSGTSHTFFNVTPGVQTVSVRDINNCEPPNQTEVAIIGYPEFLTPNDDGINDTWNVKGVSDAFYKSIFIRIYDRYGKAIYQISSFDHADWDGTYNGKKMIPNDYWFSATLIDINDNIIQKIGNISLIRNE
ncbi:T9SS type B sorting domain-containing protein [Flavobacteriaceae bacterium S356]|uniref:T9SS type B sorting domain-containing protein n=1 Tax=Asprobacillus argus TaxID=3076534 RepID=A0ABU3LJ42_9FLAO|nr:T9SS type B sorting domain-containing protein [Flavobacteriaceae bacterium S356]